MYKAKKVIAVRSVPDRPPHESISRCIKFLRGGPVPAIHWPADGKIRLYGLYLHPPPQLLPFPTSRQEVLRLCFEDLGYTPPAYAVSRLQHAYRVSIQTSFLPGLDDTEGTWFPLGSDTLKRNASQRSERAVPGLGQNRVQRRRVECSRRWR